MNPHRTLRALMTVALMFLSAGSPVQSVTPAKRVILLGFDGLDPGLCRRFMDSGDMPHLRQISGVGSFQPMRTSNPPQSPVAWSTLISGLSPGHHHVFDFVIRNPDTLLPEMGMTETATDTGLMGQIRNAVSGPTLKNRRRGPALWESLSAKDSPSVILRSPMVFPPVPLNGRLLSGMGTPDIKGSQGVFTFFTDTPSPNDIDTRGHVALVEWNGDTAVSHLTGPWTVEAGKRTEAFVQIAFHRMVRSIDIELGGKIHKLEMGRWSEWIPVQFRVGRLKTVSSMVRFHLNSISPFELYASPVNIDPVDPAMAISYPDEYAPQLAARLGRYHTQGMPYDSWALEENRISEEDFIDLSNQIFDETRAHLLYELKNFNRGFLFAYFGASDLIQHMFWRRFDPTHPRYEKSANPKISEAIPNIYRRVDELLGEVAKATPADTVLMIVSDHGFQPFRRSVNLNSWLKSQGLLVLKDSASEGKDLLSDVDWSRTRAYAVGFSGLYVNLHGREKNGIVRSSDKEKLLKEIRKRLLTWKDGGKPVVKSVYLNDQIFRGPYESDSPDLVVGYALGYRASWKTALGAAPISIIDDNNRKWSGDHIGDPHLVPGVLASNLKLAADSGIEDVAPTLLHLFGVSPQKNMNGRVLTADP